MRYHRNAGWNRPGVFRVKRVGKKRDRKRASALSEHLHIRPKLPAIAKLRELLLFRKIRDCRRGVKEVHRLAIVRRLKAGIEQLVDVARRISAAQEQWPGNAILPQNEIGVRAGNMPRTPFPR